MCHGDVIESVSIALRSTAMRGRRLRGAFLARLHRSGENGQRRMGLHRDQTCRQDDRVIVAA